MWTYWDISDPYVCLCEDFLWLSWEVQVVMETALFTHCYYVLVLQNAGLLSGERHEIHKETWNLSEAEEVKVQSWNELRRKNRQDLSPVKWKGHWGRSWTR